MMIIAGKIELSTGCIGQTHLRQYRLKQSILDELPKVRTTGRHLADFLGQFFNIG
jgi:hypothetical protein